MEKKKKGKGLVAKILTSPILYNIIAMAIVAILIIAGVLYGLSMYTRHNQSLVVPNVKDKQVGEAATLLKAVDLNYVVIDSVYLPKGKPGAIVDQTPKGNSKVKKGRTIYLTIQAKAQQMVSIPEIKDYSLRQAMAQLNSLGFKDVEVVRVPSQYVDIVVSVSYGSKTLATGDKLPKGSPLILSVGGGSMSENDDTMQQDDIENAEIEESFFE